MVGRAVLGEPPAITNGRGRPPGGPEMWQNRSDQLCHKGLGASLQGEESDMLESDQCAEISEALHEQVDRLVIRYECGDDEPLAYIWIEPVSKPDVESNTKIDNHLAQFGIRLSKRDMLQRYGRAEAADDSDALEPPSQGFGDGTSPSFGGLPNERPRATPLQNAKSPLQNAPRNPDAQRAVSAPDAPEAVFRAFAEAVSEDAKPLAEQVQKLLDLIDAGKEAEAASFAASLSANLPSYLPEDPESATVLAEAMAERYGQAWEAARRDDSHAETRRGGGAELANEITNPCPKCHRQMPKEGTCSFCAKRAANHTAGKAAFAKVADTHQDVVGAMERDSIGKIDFIWGDKSEGVCHIMDKHPEDAAMIPGVIAYGDVYVDTAAGKYYCIKKRNLVVLRKGRGTNHYLITGYQKDNPQAVAKIRKENALVEKGE